MSLPAIANASASLTASGIANARSIPAASFRHDVASQAGAGGSANASAAPASFEVSLTSGSNPASLLLKAAVTGINDSLQLAFGEGALTGTGGQKTTAAGVADQIISLITQFLEALKQKQAGEDGATTLQDLMATIRDGFEQGYEEAMNLLKGMGVLSDDMASEFARIHDLVLKGLSDFESAQGCGTTIGSNAAVATEANR